MERLRAELVADLLKIALLKLRQGEDALGQQYLDAAERQGYTVPQELAEALRRYDYVKAADVVHFDLQLLTAETTRRGQKRA